MTFHAPPRIVNQRTALLPDGTVDPASLTDCGEACVSSVAASLGAPVLSPGCLRAAAGKPASLGVTTGADIALLLKGLAFRGDLRSSGPEDSESSFRRWLRWHSYVVALGYWQGPAELHWVVAYHVGRRRLWVMDPWVGEYVPWSWRGVADVFAGTAVTVRRRAFDRR